MLHNYNKTNSELLQVQDYFKTSSKLYKDYFRTFQIWLQDIFKATPRLIQEHFKEQFKEYFCWLHKEQSKITSKQLQN